MESKLTTATPSEGFGARNMRKRARNGVAALMAVAAIALFATSPFYAKPATYAVATDSINGCHGQSAITQTLICCIKTSWR